MKKMSKTLLLSLILAAGITLSACGSKGDISSTHTSSQQTSSEAQSEEVSSEEKSQESKQSEEESSKELQSSEELPSSEDISSEEESESKEISSKEESSEEELSSEEESSEALSSGEDTPITLAGNKFKYVRVIEEDIPAHFSSYCYLEFNNLGEIRFVDRVEYPDLDPVFTTSIGTYTQDGNSFVFTLNGIYQKGEFHEYPEGMKESYKDLEGTISGKTVTMALTAGNSQGYSYYHAEFELDESPKLKGKTLNFKEFVTTGFTPEQQETLDGAYKQSSVTFGDEFANLYSPAMAATVRGYYYQCANQVYIEWFSQITDEGDEHAVYIFGFETTFDGVEIDLAVEGFDGPIYVTYSVAE